MAKEMGLDRAPIEFQTFYFSHVLVVPPNHQTIVFVKVQYIPQPCPGTPPFIMCGSFILWLAPHFGRLSEKRKPTISKKMNLTYPLPRLVVQLMIHQTNGQRRRGRFYDDLLLLDKGEYTLTVTVWLVVIVFTDAYQL